ncbi:MAG: MFS transporter, partial [Gammaproteobacteria bacterium]|nr:MFS transporter [Gammaproteobacteria bacterium]
MNRSFTPTVVFSCLGHLYIHLCTAFYFVIVLAVERDWHLPYHELIELWTLGSLMVGAAALPAGVLSDRFGAPAMMVVFFLGLGACSIAAGLTDSSLGLMLALTGLGVFAAIYHPVGIPWLVRNAGANRGKALGFNGIFGALGAAVAGVTAGFLIDVSSWRVAFIVPGLVSIATGVALLVFVVKDRIHDSGISAETAEKHSRADLARVFVVLLVTMFCAGLVFHTTQTALPKLFEQRHGGLVGSGAFGVGLLVAGVYTAAAFMQVLGGYLADRWPLKFVYAAAILFQVPLLWLAASLGGVPLLVVAALMVMANAGALPAENMLLARYT